jgi:hypothetical protein
MRSTARLTFLILALSLAAQAQTFNSGSNGSDGALNFTTPGTVDFDPSALGLDADGDNVYHFTTINIGIGVTLRLVAAKLKTPGPVVWLATGQVSIAGTLDLGGGDGHPESRGPAGQYLSIPGPGGYPGGLGGTLLSSATAGYGPGGGGTSFNSGGGGAGYSSVGGFGSSAYGNVALIPLQGGSGGGGTGFGGIGVTNGYTGSGGGAGGGAIRIASSTVIGISGSILARGGNGGPTTTRNQGGGGSGGAIHLIAPAIFESGTLNVAGGNQTSTGTDNASSGRIRIEAFSLSSNGKFGPETTVGTPYSLATLAIAPYGAIRISTVNGMTVSTNPTGSFITPDVAINQSGSVSIGVEANNIPLGTVVTLTVISESGSKQVLNTTPLAGTLALSTATAAVTFPPGFSKGWVSASWTGH